MTKPKWKDRLLVSWSKLAGECLDENIRQVEKWGRQRRRGFEWLGFLTEEVGELSQAISENEFRQGPRENIRKEAIQVATLALKIAEMNPPIKK
jgi:NTP pyrophosphatase (non-canonical NTP hydrolase)